MKIILLFGVLLGLAIPLAAQSTNESSSVFAPGAKLESLSGDVTALF